MFYRLLFVVVAFVFSLNSIHAKQNSPNSVSRKPVHILFLGDSLTRGHDVKLSQSYPSLIEVMFHERGKDHVKITNAANSGDTTAVALKVLKWQVKKSKVKPKILVLAYGANDGLRALDLKASKKNLEEVIKFSISKGIKVLLCGMKLPPNYGAKRSKDFEAMYIDLASKYPVSYLPFLLAGVAADRSANLADGIHPNAEGYARIAKLVFSKLNDIYKF